MPPTSPRTGSLDSAAARGAAWRARLRRLRRAARRSLLVRRRLLAALLVAVAVAAALQATAPRRPPTTEVVVARADLPAGTVLADGDLTTSAWAADAAPAGALAATEVVGRRLASPLRRGEPVTDVRLLSPSLLDDQPGRVAVPLRIPDRGSVALVEVGDRVDVLATDPRSREPAQTVVNGARVLALPTGAETGAFGPTGEAGGRLVVLALTPEVAATAAAAAVRSSLSLTLWG